MMIPNQVEAIKKKMKAWRLAVMTMTMTMMIQAHRKASDPARILSLPRPRPPKKRGHPASRSRQLLRGLPPAAMHRMPRLTRSAVQATHGKPTCLPMSAVAAATAETTAAAAAMTVTKVEKEVKEGAEVEAGASVVVAVAAAGVTTAADGAAGIVEAEGATAAATAADFAAAGDFVAVAASVVVVVAAVFAAATAAVFAAATAAAAAASEAAAGSEGAGAVAVDSAAAAAAEGGEAMAAGTGRTEGHDASGRRAPTVVFARSAWNKLWGGVRRDMECSNPRPRWAGALRAPSCLSLLVKRGWRQMENAGGKGRESLTAADLLRGPAAVFGCVFWLVNGRV